MIVPPAIDGETNGVCVLYIQSREGNIVNDKVYYKHYSPNMLVNIDNLEGWTLSQQGTYGIAEVSPADSGIVQEHVVEPNEKEENNGGTTG